MAEQNYLDVVEQYKEQANGDLLLTVYSGGTHKAQIIQAGTGDVDDAELGQPLGWVQINGSCLTSDQLNDHIERGLKDLAQAQADAVEKSGPCPAGTFTVGDLVGVEAISDRVVVSVIQGTVIDAEQAEDMMLDFVGPSEWIETRPANAQELKQAKALYEAAQAKLAAEQSARRREAAIKARAERDEDERRKADFMAWLAENGVGAEHLILTHNMRGNAGNYLVKLGEPDPYNKQAKWFNHGTRKSASATNWPYDLYRTPQGHTVAYSSGTWEALAFGTSEALAELRELYDRE